MLLKLILMRTQWENLVENKRSLSSAARASVEKLDEENEAGVHRILNIVAIIALNIFLEFISSEHSHSNFE